MDVHTCPTCGATIPADSTHWLVGVLVYCDEHGPAAQYIAGGAERPTASVVQIGGAANVAAWLAAAVERETV